MSDSIRSPICVVVGHVDHGKSSVLDQIRNTNIVAGEAGKITQAIGASIIPIDIIKKKCGDLLTQLNMTFTIPGLLFIDTPGHAAFSSLRRRGGNLADIAILVVDMNEGFKPQTIESIKILKEYKTPFIVAANKIDKIHGYKTIKQTNTASILGNIQKQQANVITQIETKMYEIVGQLSEQGLPSERFDRISNFTQEIGIVPISAMKGDGMSELLMVLSALAQKYLEANLHANVEGQAKGTILEVKEEKGMGTVVDAIIYDGIIKTNDTIVIGDMGAPIVTKVRGLYEPANAADMRDKKSKYNLVKQAVAATGVRICAPGLENAKSGMPIATATAQTLEAVKKEIVQEIEDVKLPTQKDGIIIKADTIGSLEALIALLQEAEIPVRLATVGNISKKDILEAQANLTNNPLYGIILGFNITCDEPYKDIKIFTSPVIYELVENFVLYKKEQEELALAKQKKDLKKLVKMHYMSGCSFRNTGPAVVGVHVMLGEATPRMVLEKQDGSKIGTIKGFEANKESLSLAKKDMQLACSIDGATINKTIFEEDLFYTQVSEKEFREFKENKDLLSEDQKEILKEIAQYKRKQNPVWGID
ncbi:MAG: translation initiation factor 5B [Candidatus Woesearchaeota archaeon]|jgi:translation initiation factor 5B